MEMKKIASLVLLAGGLSLAGVWGFTSVSGQKMRAKLGSHEAQYELAMRYTAGDGVLESRNTALHYIRDPFLAGHTGSLQAICSILSQASSQPSLETCMSDLKERPSNRLWALIQTALLAQEWAQAETLIAEMRETGDVRSGFEHARFLMLSDRSSEGVMRALEDVTQGAQAGDPRAQYAAVLHQLNAQAEGKLTAPFAELMVRNPAISQADAYFELSKLLRTGAVSSDLSYEEVLKRSDQMGNIYAATHLARYYGDRATAENDVVSRELQVQWTKKAAENGDPVAQYNLAAYLLQQETPDGEEILSNLENAAAQGFSAAITMQGVLLFQGRFGAKDQERGLALLNQAAQKGDATALFNLGQIMLANGQTDSGKKLLEKSAAAGNPQAAALLEQLDQS